MHLANTFKFWCSKYQVAQIGYTTTFWSYKFLVDLTIETVELKDSSVDIHFGRSFFM